MGKRERMRAIAGEMGRRRRGVEDVMREMVAIGVMCAVPVLLVHLYLAMVVVRGCVRVCRALVGSVCRGRRHETGKLVT